jgi:hypothetical protein
MKDWYLLSSNLIPRRMAAAAYGRTAAVYLHQPNILQVEKDFWLDGESFNFLWMREFVLWDFAFSMENGECLSNPLETEHVVPKFPLEHGQ